MSSATACSPATSAARWREGVEQLERDLLAAKRATKVTVGSYMFELQREQQLVVKWEPDFPDVVQGIEPFAHISKPLDGWARDKRLWGAAKDVIGQENIGLFTEKITMKRARTGGTIILHQDYPYWRDQNKVAHKVMTAMIQLDDADRNNGCLEVLPGSHRDGMRIASPRRSMASARTNWTTVQIRSERTGRSGIAGRQRDLLRCRS